MYLTIKQQLKHLSKEDYENLRSLCHTAKDLTNQALYCVRQYFFNEHKYLGYEKVYAELRTCDNYKLIAANMSQQLLKEVDGSFKSFFALLRLIKEKGYPASVVEIPHYLPKDGFTTLVIQEFSIRDGIFVVPYSRAYNKDHSKVKIKVPPILEGKKVKEIRIIPKNNARFFEIQYTYESVVKIKELDKSKALAIDFGVNNLATCVTSEGDSFIIDGRKLKSINQWYNKQNARLQSIKDKQKFGKGRTEQQKRILHKRNNRVNDYISKMAKMVVKYCLAHNIGNLVCGYNVTFQQNSNLGKANNQNFVNLPFGQLRDKLTYLCKLYGIAYTEQEESYTSKASFWDNDDLPVYNADNPQEYEFSGKRVKRGLYCTSTGKTLNADVNGALNILKKSRVVALTGLYSRGEVTTPVRIRVS
jgi:IS605 OrfB family transposase